MFYLYSDLTIRSSLPLCDLAGALAELLQIPVFGLSDRYDGREVYVTRCFGLEFELGADDDRKDSFHLTVNSNTDIVDFDGAEVELDGAKYILQLLQSSGLKAEIRGKDLLY